MKKLSNTETESKKSVAYKKKCVYIDPTFRNINRLFVLPFKNGVNDPTRHCVDRYYMPLAEIKDFTVLIDNK